MLYNTHNMSLEMIYILFLSIFALTTTVGVPGPLLVAVGAILYGFQTGFVEFSGTYLVIFLILGIFGVLVDNIFALLGAKKFGASKYGMIGAVLGFFLTFVIGPLGIIVGPALGAFTAEKIVNKKTTKDAAKAAGGAVLGLMTGLVLKVIIAISMVVWFGFIVL